MCQSWISQYILLCTAQSFYLEILRVSGSYTSFASPGGLETNTDRISVSSQATKVFNKSNCSSHISVMVVIPQDAGIT